VRFRSQNRHVIDFIFPLAVFFVFAASSFAVLVLSANIYNTQTKESNSNYVARTSLAYVNEKIRQNDEGGGISIQSVDGRDCLVLAGNSDGIAYTTYIYEYDGSLKELFIRDGVSASLKSGKDIMELESFQMEEIEEGLFRFVFTDKDGRKSSSLVAERSTP